MPPQMQTHRRQHVREAWTQLCIASVGIGTCLWAEKLLLEIWLRYGCCRGGTLPCLVCPRASSRRALLLSRASSSFRSRSAKISKASCPLTHIIHRPPAREPPLGGPLRRPPDLPF